MANTIRDFIIECELFPHSRENFEFLKECKEIEIAEKFINDQLFLSEANIDRLNEAVNFENNFFQESVDGCSLDVLTEQTNFKSGSLLSKIIDKICKIFKVFSKFFSKIANKFDDVSKSGQALLKKLNSTTFDENGIKGLMEIIDNVRKFEPAAFPIRRKQPYANKIKLKYVGPNYEHMTALKDGLAVALSDDVVIAEALFGDDNVQADPDRIGIMDPDEIYKAAITLYAGKESEILNVANNLITSWGYVKLHGLKIDVNTKSIYKTAEQLNSVSEKLLTLSEDIQLTVARFKSTVSTVATLSQQAKDAVTGSESGDSALIKLINDSAASHKFSDVVNKMNDVVGMITAAIGKTTRVYTQLNAYRRSVIANVNYYLKPEGEAE